MKTLEDIFDHTTEDRDVTSRSLLVAEPFMTGEWFRRSVIVPIASGATEGAMGLVLGHKTDMTLDKVVDGAPKGLEMPVYLGGPVGHNRLFAVHALGADFNAGDRALANGLWLSTDLDRLMLGLSLDAVDPAKVRFMVGYSGWSAGQLESEIENNTWAVCDNTLDPLMLLDSDGDKLWREVVRSMGDTYRHWLLHPRMAIQN